jgi:hypothetical protein
MSFLLLLLTLPAVVEAQFIYTTNHDTITITEYTGPGGDVVVPSTTNGLPVTSIGDGAFVYCTSLTGVTIPNSVTSISGSAFAGCTGLVAINVDVANMSYSSVEGVLFDKSQTKLVAYPDGKARSYSIPMSVSSIGDSAFQYCASLANVTIPNSVTSIGDYAFDYCVSLTSITIPDSVTSIGDWAFDLCTGLTTLTIPDSVTSIGDGGFASTSVTSVTIPSSVTNIGVNAFEQCSGLVAINVDMANVSYTSVDGVLFDKSQTTLIQYPAGNVAASYTIPDSVTHIGDYSFFQGANLTNVTIPNGVINIGEAAFAGCSLTSVTIPNSVTRIGNWAFDGCSLTSVIIPDSVTNLGAGAFVGCSSLTSVTIGNGVTNIGSEAFYHCLSLTGVHFNGNAPSLGSSDVFYGDDNATIYYLLGTMGWGATFGGLPTARWSQVPTIQTQPQTQTAEAGSAVGFRVRASSPLPLFYFWHLDATNLVVYGTNWQVELPEAQLEQSGAYTIVISNVLGAITSAPAMLQVIAPVERRPVPGLKVSGAVGSLLNVDYADSLSPAPIWTPLGSASLTSTSQYYFDLTLPLPAQRFYRAWQTGTPGVMPSLDLHLVPAIRLTGNIGHSVRVDYITVIRLSCERLFGTCCKLGICVEHGV